MTLIPAGLVQVLVGLFFPPAAIALLAAGVASPQAEAGVGAGGEVGRAV